MSNDARLGVVKPIRYGELVKLLRSVSAEKVRTVGSHEVWKVGSCQTVVPHHAVVAAGTLRKIRDQLAPCVGKDWLRQ
jgi:predicted RNA binding protein YcfA (HicA-like mRNA interferase family)